MNGNASTGEPPGKKASHEVKAGEACFEIYRLLQVQDPDAHLLCTEEAQKYKL